ncbi:MAG: sulfite exporter TauE/SafE family protein [Sulfurimonas sp.]|nr:sulfite exporter TauE/SafE family protein [Sulfurimonas sp.]MDQ7062275.1 sulfite exporter TauE/SafE family protein [Sulfurimonas sp.]
MLELLSLGFFVGVLSGFFGVGGGTILIPLLLFLGYATKEAIGISVLQMVFSSVYGSYLNQRRGTLDISMVLPIGIGGSIGALLSGYITSSFDDLTLEIIFLSFALFALMRLFFKTKEDKKELELNKFVLLGIGVPLGALSMTIGVGGSILLVPILVGFFHVSLKKAISAGLFFVVFSSFAGLISHSILGEVNYEVGLTVGLASLFGVYLGIYLKDKIDATLQKRLLVGFYLLIVVYLIYRIF